MRLSMWILANQLSAMEPEVHIRPDSPMVLRSGRLDCAVGSVQVRQDGPDCLCTWEGDSIRIFHMDVREGLGLVQSIFDSMTDWYSAVSAAAAAREYQKLVDMCHVVLHSPVLLMDENGRVLGISAHYGAGDVDEEWRYLKTYGYASLQAIENILTQQAPVTVSNEVVRMHPRHSGRYSAGLTTRIYRNGRPLGRLTVLEREQPLNRGHMQIVQAVAALLAGSLEPSHGESYGSGAYLSRLMEGAALGETAWEHLRRTRGWEPRHTYRLYGFAGGEGDWAPLQGILTRTLSEGICAVSDGLLWALVNESTGSGQAAEALEDLASSNGIHLSRSLPADGVTWVPSWKKQVRYAIQRGQAEAPEALLWDFAVWAVDYLLWGTREPSELLAACHPDVRRLWQQKAGGDAMLCDTLQAYLEQDRSAIRTAEALFIHKNTFFYRLRKLQEGLTADLDDPAVRLHLLLSFRILSEADAAGTT